MTTSPFSLVDGGPLCRVIRRLGWVRPDGGCDYRRACIAIMVVTSGPLLVLALSEHLLTARAPQSIDWGVHARLLVTIPLLFVAEASLHGRTGLAMEIFRSQGWARDQEDRVTRSIAAAVRLRDAAAPEVILLGLALVLSQAVVWQLSSVRTIVQQLMLDPHLVAPRYWYALVALPAFQFLVYRALWRWGIWALLLWRLSRLPLRPIATHPDLAGGLGFMAMPSAGFAYVVAGLSAAQAGVWANKVAATDVSLASFSSHLLLFILGAGALALGPLVAFTGHLWRCRLAGKVQYGALARDYTRQFHARWIEQGRRDDLLGNPDIQSLADLASSYSVVERTRLVPFPPLLSILIAVAAVVPAIPVALLRIPLTELLLKAGAALLGKG
jgi:hypothetical protein